MTIDSSVAAVAEETEAYRASSRPTRRGAAVLLLTGAVVLGVSSTAYTTIVFAVVMAVVAVALLNARPVVWIALAITVVWTSRLVTVPGFAPRFLDFADFPLVLIAFVVAGTRFLSTTRVLPASHQRVCRWLIPVTVVIALSWAFAGLSEPQRLVAGWVLATEPFLLLVAVLLAPMSHTERRRLLMLTTVLLCVQVLFSLAQIPSAHHPDDVKGTLLATGAGHHVSAGGAALGFMVLARLRVSKVLLLVYGAVAVFVMISADAKQVLFLLCPALLVLAISGRRRTGSAVSLIGSVLTGVLMAGTAGYLAYEASSTSLSYADRSIEDNSGKSAVAQAVWADASETWQGTLLGLGPGQTVSRFSFLTTPTLLKAGSPVALLGLSPSEGADRYQDIAVRDSSLLNSSFTSAQSSALGIFGDYGLLGSLAFGGLILAVLRALRRCDDRLRSSALAAWVLLLPLAVIFDWLEQPPFTLTVSVITGLALRVPATLEQQQVRQPSPSLLFERASTMSAVVSPASSLTRKGPLSLW